MRCMVELISLMNNYYLFARDRLYPKSARIRYNAYIDKVKIACWHTFEDRSIKSILLFMQAFEKAKPLIKKSFKINIYCGDSPRKDMPIFAYSRKNMQKKIIAIPDFN